MGSQPPFSGESEEWDEHEMVYLAVEIFRQRDRARTHSPRPSRYPAAQLLFENLRSDSAEPPWSPTWEDLALPKGRSLNSCKSVFNSFSRRSGAPYQQGPTTGNVSLQSISNPTRKRSHPHEAAAPIGRPLAPKQPATFPTDSRALMSHSLHQPLSPLGEPAPGATEPRKKRGRPTKKEQEERRRLHAERSQAVQSPNPLRSPFGLTHQTIAPQAPIEAGASALGGQSTPTAVITTPRTLPAETETHSGSSSGKKRRGRPPKPIGTSEEPLQPPTFPTLGQQASSAYSSPPHSAPISARERRSSISTRSTGTPAGPSQQDQRADSEEARRRQRSWNDTVMGQSNPRPS